MKKFLCFLGGAMLLFDCYGQKIKSLNVGDTVPNLLIDNVFNCDTPKFHLSDFKNELVILDFWATWCGSCIKGFPKTDSLQEEFKDKLQILLINPKITGDDLKKINSIVRRTDSLLGKEFSVPVIAYDTVLTSMFKFRLLPHYVWIDKNRIVIAITHKKDVTRKNIQAILNGQRVSLQLKDDFSK